LKKFKKNRIIFLLWHSVEEYLREQRRLAGLKDEQINIIQVSFDQRIKELYQLLACSVEEKRKP
jgi:hypothetical protein